MTQFVGDYKGPSVALRFRGAFVVTPASMRATAHAISAFGGGDAGPCTIKLYLKSGGDPLQYDGVEPALAYRNPKAAPIIAVVMRLEGGVRRALVAFDSEGREAKTAIVVDAAGEDQGALSSLAAHFAAEAKNLATWYSPVLGYIDALRSLGARAPMWVLWVVVVLCALIPLGLVLNTVRLLWRRQQLREEARELLAAVDRAAPLDPNTQARLDKLQHFVDTSGIGSGLMIVGFAAGAFAAGTLANPLLEYLFPRVDFLIGEGAQRHERLRATRNVVLITILLSGIIIPFLRSVMAGK